MLIFLQSFAVIGNRTNVVYHDGICASYAVEESIVNRILFTISCCKILCAAAHQILLLFIIYDNKIHITIKYLDLYLLCIFDSKTMCNKKQY